MLTPHALTHDTAVLIASSEEGGGGSVMSLVILLLIPVGMYFLLIRPQRKRSREQQALQASISVGDEVMTTSGIYGFISAIEEETDVIWLEIDDDVQIRLSRAAISGKAKVPTSPTGGDDADDADDSDDGVVDDDGDNGDEPPSRPGLKGSANGGSGTE